MVSAQYSVKEKEKKKYFTFAHSSSSRHLSLTFVEFEVVFLRAPMESFAQGLWATEEYAHLTLLWRMCLRKLAKDLVKVRPSIVRWRTKSSNRITVQV